MDPKLVSIVASFPEREAKIGRALGVMVEELYKFNDEVLAEAKALFHKQSAPQGDTSEDKDRENEEDPNEESFAVPVLLPQTPRVKRTAKKKLSSQKMSPSRTERPSRAASRVARGIISKTTNEKLGTKKRRPTNASSTKEAVTSKIIDTTIKSSSGGILSSMEKSDSRDETGNGSGSKRAHFDGEPKDKKRKISADVLDEEKTICPREDEKMDTKSEEDMQVFEEIAPEETVASKEKDDAVVSSNSPDEDEKNEKDDEKDVESVSELETEEFTTVSHESEEEMNDDDMEAEPVEETRSSRRLTRTKTTETHQETTDCAPNKLDKRPPRPNVQNGEQVESLPMMDSGAKPNISDEKAGVEGPRRRVTRSVSQKKLPSEEPKVEETKRRTTRSISIQNIPLEEQQVEESKRRMTRSVSHQKLPSQDANEPRRLTRSASHQKLPAYPKNLPAEETMENKDVSIVDALIEKHMVKPDMEKQSGDRIRKNSQDNVPVIKVTHPSVSGPDQETEKQIRNTLPRQKITRTTSAAAVRNVPKIGSSAKAPSTSHLIAAAKASASKMGGGTKKLTTQSPAVDNPSSSFASKFRSRIQGHANSPLKKIPSNITTAITSFLPGRPLRNQKPTADQLIAQKEEDLRKKKEKEEEAVRRKEERDRQKREDIRKANEARQQKVLRSRQQMEKQKQEARLQQERDNREKLEAVKKAQAMAEERKRKEMEEEKRKKEEEERIRKLEEEKKKEKENQIAKKKAEEKRLRDIQEKERQLRLQEEIKKQKIRLEELHAQASEGGNLNSTYTKPGDSTFTKPSENPNSTYNKNDNYEITPARHELPQEVLVDPNNYDIADLKSDEDTDDEDNPKKKPAKWAMGKAYKEALYKQAGNPPDVDLIFFIQDACPKLEEIFPQQKRRFFHRTSSAVWDRPPMTHKFK